MNIRHFKNILPAALLGAAAFGFTACTGDLDVENINPQQVSAFDQDAIFAKIYANMALTGQTGPDGNSDLDASVDEGFSSMVRQIWNANELSTDEAICRWGDAGIPEYNHNSWNDSHEMLRSLYYRLMFGLTISNFFLDEATGSDEKTLTQRAEARFMRALYYYYLMDLYGNPPFVTTVSSEKAKQATRAEVFKFIEDELKAVLGETESNEVLMDAKTNTYGRADKAAAWMLLARIYLNAQVYAGENRFNDAKTYAKKVMDSGYKLCNATTGGYSSYQLLFMGDNDTNGAQDEIILPAMFDGEKTQTWGGTMFLIASVTTSDILADYPTGSSAQWEGNRCRAQFSRIFFPGVTDATAVSGTPFDLTVAANDDRALFYTKGHTVEVLDESAFKNGWSYIKYLNTHADESSVKHTDYVDTDFPMMRAAEAYLTFAEADARINGGVCSGEGLKAINDLRDRAHAKKANSMTTREILDEWAKEFGFEGRRRIDLVRYEFYGGQTVYKWEWMGGTKNGSMFPKEFNVFPLPISDLNANKNLKQNAGY